MCSALVSSKSLLRKERKVSKQKQMFTFNFWLCVDWGDWGRGFAGQEKMLSESLRKSCRIESAFPLILLWFLFGPVSFYHYYYYYYLNTPFP